MVSFIKVSLWDIPGLREPVARLSAAQAGRTYFPEAMLRICPGYRAMQSGSPDRYWFTLPART
ncbi:hypothetical protein KCD71_001179 [Salmonella enterica subsp. enterica serovar Heidelberg]|uniref:hypothetical protein n=1 Tax=Salmonella enterica TaxID=28901 RepID=UPI0011BA92BF|nr:hypothetical protein [Salmonella enterica]MCR6042087.1 hypothetical protein [Salmonella enterica subsp. enterica]HCB4829849.1 hypothetical protein [Salmonella enterica subsp. enterica serovar Typhimurium]EAW1528276.1 hypothetical protein [Salmonella enterica]EAX4448499.1 hypothetical protein [Salmonella enterica]EAY6348581.1 hypothetical protein [Salmonella enterica]